MPRKIDAHCHLWDPNSGRWPVTDGVNADDRDPLGYTADDHLDALGKLGIEAAVAVPHIGYYGRSLEYAFDCAKRFPTRISVMGAITGPEIRDPALLSPDVERGVRSFRMRAPEMMDAAEIETVCGWLNEREVVLCPLIKAGQSDALEVIDHIAALYPKLTIVLDHFAGVPGSDALKRLARHENAHVKISGFNTFDKPPYHAAQKAMSDLLPAFGADRMMWGSDMPVFNQSGTHSLSDAFSAINGADDLTTAQRDALMGGTAERLFFERKH